MLFNPPPQTTEVIRLLVSELIEMLEELQKLKARGKATVKQGTKTKRKVSAYSKKYGKAFKKVQSKYKTKAGKWKKDGFKRAQKAAHAMAKRMK